MNIAFFAALLTLLGGSAAADNLIPYRYKKRLHDAAVRFWLRLYENEIPDLPRLLANGILKRTLNIRRRPLLTFLIYLAICAIFLSVVYSLIPFLEPPGPVVHLPTSPELRHFRPDFFDKMPLPRIELVLTIAAFDLVTLALSIHLLKSLRKDKIGVWGCKFIVHLAVIWLLAITCLATADSVGNFLFSRAALGLRYEYIEFGESQRMAFNYFASQNTNFNGGKTLGTNFIAAQITYGDSFGVNW